MYRGPTGFCCRPLSFFLCWPTASTNTALVFFSLMFLSLLQVWTGLGTLKLPNIVSQCLGVIDVRLSIHSVIFCFSFSDEARMSLPFLVCVMCSAMSDVRFAGPRAAVSVN